MNFTAICRTCLTTDYLHPIFVKTVDHKRYSTAIFITTGIKVDIDDGLPQQMCAGCVHFLNNSLKFRKQCKDSEARLLQIKNDAYVTETISGDEAVDEDFNDKDVKLVLKLEEGSRINGGVVSDGYVTETISGDEAVDEDFNDEDVKLEVKLEEDNRIDGNIVNVNSKGNDAIEEKESDQPAYPPTKERHSRKRHATFKAEKITRIACHLCQKDLSVRSIHSHMAKCHPGADDRRIKCELCDSYVTKEKMNRHIKMMHGNREFRCGYCKSLFDDKEVLVDHVANCTAKRKRRKITESGRELTECEVCHKTMQRASLRSHVAVKHRGLGPVCEHCGRKFGNRLRLSEHLRAKHGYEKFKCEHCEFTSASIAALRNHERRHRGEKPFVCEQCGAKFHAAYLLAQHKQSHRTEKRVKCPLCCAVFKAGNSLHAHRLAVHGAALHRCPLCARAYSCRHYAVKHMRAVHHYKGPVPPLQVEPNPNEM